MKYKIYQIAEYGGYDKPPKPIEKKDVSDDFYVSPTGEIIYKHSDLIQDSKYFKIEIIER